MAPQRIVRTFPLPVRPLGSAAVAAAAFGLMLAGLPVRAAGGAGSGFPVGEATLVIGQASITAADGSVRDAQRGSELRVGDRVETQGGAHVHVRFVDGARVSIRPSSRLQVEQYAQNGSIKFRLDEGTVRSITGAWGEAARDRFRLNTPVAAIGIKGTDFVVRSAGDTTAAAVFSGAIVFAPMSAVCAATVGPCLNGGEKLLTAEMKGQMVEINRGQFAPRVVPAVDLIALARDKIRAAVDASERRSDPRVDGRAEDRAGDSGPNPLPVQFAGGSSTRPGAAVSEKPAVSDALAAATLASAELAAVSRALSENDLVWVRFPWAIQLSSDDFTKQFDAAMLRGTISLTSDGAYSLRRSDVAAFKPQVGAAAFRMTSGAAAVFRGADAAPEQLRFTSARLSIDFDRSLFATDMTLAGPKLGESRFQAVGSVDSQGAMKSAAGSGWLGGGLSADGSKAGMAFRRDVPGGVLQGITSWGR